LLPGDATEHAEEWWLFGNIAAGEDDAWIESAIVPLAKQTEE
jgi:hypothetical protein